MTAAAYRTTAAAFFYVVSLFAIGFQAAAALEGIWALSCVLVPVFVGSLLILVGWLQLIGACVLGLRQFVTCAAAALGLYAATSRWTAATAAAALNIRDTLVFDEVQTSDLVTTTLSPSKGPREAFQEKATPRVDVAEVTSVPSSQQALCVKSCFDHFPGSFGDDTPGSLVTPPSGLSFMLVTLSGKTLTMNEDPGIIVSELLDKIAGLSALPTSAFYLTFGHTCLTGMDTLKSAGLQRDSLIRMRGRLLGGTARGPRNFQVPGSWHCSFCNMGGCWPGRDRCFRCNNPRFSNARRPLANRTSQDVLSSMGSLVNPRFVLLARSLRLNRPAPLSCCGFPVAICLSSRACSGCA